MISSEQPPLDVEQELRAYLERRFVDVDIALDRVFRDFVTRLDGYEVGGLHTHFADIGSDADDIIINSSYVARGLEIANIPGDEPTLYGILATDMFYSGTATAVQTYTGLNGALNGKVWIRNKSTTWGAWTLVSDSDSAAASIGTKWQYSDTTTAADPGSGNFQLNDTTIADATSLYINSVNKVGTDFDSVLGAVSIGDKIYIQNLETSDERLLVSVTGVTDNVGWWTFDFTVDDSNGPTWTDGKEFGVLLMIGIVGAGGGTAFAAIGRVNVANGVVDKDNGFFTASNVITGQVDVTFNSTQTDENYMVQVTPDNNIGAIIVTVEGHTTSGFTINTFDSSGTRINTQVMITCIRVGQDFIS